MPGQIPTGDIHHLRLTVTDLERSRAFYKDQVGLNLSARTVKNHLLFECGDGTTILIYGRPSPNQATHTEVRFWSDDVHADVRDLESRGIVFEEVNLARDPEGRARLTERTGQMPFPQILIGERAIGGFRELLEADREGTLKALLAA